TAKMWVWPNLRKQRPLTRPPRPREVFSRLHLWAPSPSERADYQKRNTLPSPPFGGRGDGGEGMAPMVHDLVNKLNQARISLPSRNPRILQPNDEVTASVLSALHENLRRLCGESAALRKSEPGLPWQKLSQQSEQLLCQTIHPLNRPRNAPQFSPDERLGIYHAPREYHPGIASSTCPGRFATD